jgi:hypothetical protein
MSISLWSAQIAEARENLPVTNLKGLVTISSPLSLFSLSDMIAVVREACSVVLWRQWLVAAGRDEVKLEIAGNGLTSLGARIVHHSQLAASSGERQLPQRSCDKTTSSPTLDPLHSTRPTDEI